MIPLAEEVESVDVLRERVRSLRAKRGMALMDGEPVQDISSEIVMVLESIEALEDKQAAERRRDLDVGVVQRENNKVMYEKQLEHFTDKALIAVREAELAMRTFAEAYKSMRSLYYAAAQVKHGIEGKIPTGWNLLALNDRFGYRIGAILSEIDRLTPYRIGHLTWKPGPYPTDCSWVELEAGILKRKS